MNVTRPSEIRHLREMARRESAATMFRDRRSRLGSSAHILDIVRCLRDAFCLSLAEAKPVFALTRSTDREITDEAEFNRFVTREIEKHRPDWDK